MDLKGQVAVVTGAGTGIGRAVSLRLADHGVKVVVCGRRAAPIRQTVRRLEERGGTGLAVRAGVSRTSDVRRVIEAAIQAYRRVDILINNAGISGGGPIHRHRVDEWDRLLAVNLRGPFLMARAVLPGMRRRRRGQIINISSESGLEHYESDGAYGVSKHALNALGEYIQRENQALGIRVATICPGMVWTEMSRGALGLVRDLCLTDEDIADLVLWLLTRHANLKIGRPVLIQTIENPWKG